MQVEVQPLPESVYPTYTRLSVGARDFLFAFPEPMTAEEDAFMEVYKRRAQEQHALRLGIKAAGGEITWEAGACDVSHEVKVGDTLPTLTMSVSRGSSILKTPTMVDYGRLVVFQVDGEQVVPFYCQKNFSVKPTVEFTTPGKTVKVEFWLGVLPQDKSGPRPEHAPSKFTLKEARKYRYAASPTFTIVCDVKVRKRCLYHCFVLFLGYSSMSLSLCFVVGFLRPFRVLFCR